MIKTKIQNVLHKKQNHQIILVQSKKSTENYNVDNEVIDEPKHLITFRVIWKIIDSLSTFCGVSAYKDVEFKGNYRLFFSIFLIFVGFVTLFYTIAGIWSNIPALLETICLFGILVPASLKFKLVLSYTPPIISVNDFFENILISNPDGKRAYHLDKEMNDAFKKVKIFIVVTLLCFAVFSLYPIHAYVNENRLVPLMRLEFPYLDQTYMTGYLVGLAIMLLLGVFAICGSVAFDLMALIQLLVYGSLVTHLVLDLDDYREMWNDKESFSSNHREHFLRNICMKYQDINSYLRFYSNILSTNTCFCICIMYGSLICAVFAVLNNGWISGYGFCVFGLVQLYIPCILGTYVMNQNDRLNQAFYFTPWYEYPVSVQKTILSLLHATAFNAEELKIGPFAPLNVGTALQMTKSIYSYYTAMSNLE